MRRAAAVLAIVITLPACAPMGHARASVSLSAVLFAVQDGELALHEAGILSDADHVRFSRVMVDVLEAGQAYNRAVLAGQPGDLAAVADQLGRLAAEVSDFAALDEASRAHLSAVVAMAVRLVDTMRLPDAI